MNGTRIIGIGSPFGADQVGWLLVDALRHEHMSIYPEHRFTFEKTDRPGTRLLSLLQGTNSAVIIDALDDRDRAGEVIQLDKSDLLVNQTSLSSHYTGVAETLQLGESLSLLPEQVFIFGICIDAACDALPSAPVIGQLAREVALKLTRTLSPARQ